MKQEMGLRIPTSQLVLSRLFCKHYRDLSMSNQPIFKDKSSYRIYNKSLNLGILEIIPVALGNDVVNRMIIFVSC